MMSELTHEPTHESMHEPMSKPMKKPYRIGVVGNPNCGKTTLFNALTGAKQRVGNWPGVTVERKIGRYRLDDAEFELVDLPGTYTLDVTSDDVSLDEKIARDYVHGGEADLILNIVDASNLERNLYLTAQLLEMRRPMVVALNMMDAAEAAGLRIDIERLAAQLGCPVVPVVAVKREGIKALKQALAKAVVEKPLSRAELRYNGALEQAITALRPKLERAVQAAGADSRWLASRLLEGDDLSRQQRGGDAQGPGLAQPFRSHRPGHAQSRAGDSDLPRRDVPDVHVYHQHRRCLHRLL